MRTDGNLCPHDIKIEIHPAVQTKISFDKGFSIFKDTFVLNILLTVMTAREFRVSRFSGYFRLVSVSQ